MRTLELLAPAKNLQTGVAAIDHGADAVYIGAPSHGARQAAANSIDDIAELCSYAHRFGAKVHVTVNTIVYDHELDDTMAMIGRLADAGVDALLIQDMGVLSRTLQLRHERAGHPFPALHASTQCDTRTADKAHFLVGAGFERVVLARELSVDEIAEIHAQLPDVELEAFVHGALCVSYSGQCYASEYCFHRSANRGACAQFCRLKFQLEDAAGEAIDRPRHWLSLKDMCQIDHIEELADAGACSFKIEGRLKEVDYVKNVVAAYSQRLNEIIARRPEEYTRASRGSVEYIFKPNLRKTFNRGYTTYFMHGRQPDISSPDTPKAIGEMVGHVKEIRGRSFNVAGTVPIANGDGLCFVGNDRELHGFRANKVDSAGRVYPLRMPEGLRPGQVLYRNLDTAFVRQMSGTTAVRSMQRRFVFAAVEGGFALSSDDKEARVQFDHQLAAKPQHDNIVRQLSKLGGTPFEGSEVIVERGSDDYFIPSSLLSTLRRNLVDQLMQTAQTEASEQPFEPAKPIEPQPATTDYKWQYLYNVSNEAARRFYAAHGLPQVAPAFELRHDADGPLMQCRYCLRYAMGHCVKRGGTKPTWREPLILGLSDGRKFRLEFDCKYCQMNVYAQ